MSAKTMVSSRQGSILILTVFGLMLIMGMVAMVTDIGWMYYQKARLETAVNSAWKAGFDESGRLMNANGGAALSLPQQNQVIARVKDVFKQNNYSDADANALMIQFSSAIASYPGHLEVFSNKQCGLFFGPLLGFFSAQVSADRGSNLISLTHYDDGGLGVDVVPIGIPHGELVSQGTAQGNKEFFGYRAFQNGETFLASHSYLLRLGVAPGGVNEASVSTSLRWSSNHGSLDLGNKGGGANEYRDYFINGYQAPINVNDRITLKSGQMDGPVTQALSIRVTTKDLQVVIPIVDVPQSSETLYELNGTNTPVRIIGFAVFTITPPDANTPSGAFYGTFVDYIINPWDVASQLN